MALEIFRFGDFELDRGAYQLRRAGTGVHLQRIPFQLLSLLVERRGQLVTQEEILEYIWGKGVFVDSENAIRTAVRKIRRALNDDADAPRFIITVPARGYRFAAPTSQTNGTAAGTDEIATVATGSPSASILPVSSTAPREEKPGPRQWARGVAIMVVLALSSALSVLALHLSLRPPTPSASIPPAQTPALPLPDKPSIAVLPFTNMSGDRDQEYFSDGITDDLITALSRVPGLFVIAHTSTFTYKGKAAKAQDIGRELGVAYLLEGSVGKSGNKLRITAQLVDTTGGNHLWAQRFDRPLKDIFALQDEIVEKIVTTLKLQLTLEQQGWVSRKHTDNLEAYDYYLRGLVAFNFTKEANAKARQLWEKAVALDPEYAEAYAQLGRTYFLEWAYHWSEDPQTPKRALELERKALSLDDSLPMAHSRLGMLYSLQQKYDRAIAEAQQAIALDPNNADSYFFQANVLNNSGRPEEALGPLTQAMRLNPRYPPLYLEQLGFAYLQIGRYAEAIATLTEANRRSPRFGDAHSFLALSILEQWLSQESPAAQTLESALTAAQRAVALNEHYVFSHRVLGLIYLYQQQYDRALVEMERAVTVAPTEARNYAGLAMVQSYMGRSEDALEATAQALRLQSRSIPYFNLADVGKTYAVSGRYKEARTPLQEFISRYPNWIDTHLMLAVVYSELGEAAEARAEATEVLRLNPHFSLAVHKQRMPIRDPTVLERHLADLRQAGLK